MIIIPRKKVKIEWWIYHHKPPIRTWQLIRAQAGPPGHVTSALPVRASENFPKPWVLSVTSWEGGGCVITLSWCHDSSPWLVISLHCHCRLYPQYYAEHCPRKLDKFSATIVINCLTWGRCCHNSGSSSRLSRGQGWAGGRGNPDPS